MHLPESALALQTHHREMCSTIIMIADLPHIKANGYSLSSRRLALLPERNRGLYFVCWLTRIRPCKWHSQTAEHIIIFLPAQRRGR